jgi:hypothetical protein
MNRSLIAAAFLALTSAAVIHAAPAEPGWLKVASTQSEGCVMYVPPDWKITEFSKSTADSPDYSSRALVGLSVTAHSVAEVKKMLEVTYKPTKVFEDTPQRLFYQYEHDQRHNYYMGVLVPGGVCGAQITFKTAAQQAVARKIAMSVGAS